MSSKFELTISSDYVKNWGVFQAVRELLQNAIDEETQNPENKFFFHYEEDAQTLSIGNKYSVLNVESLLLGITTKSEDNHTIGQFGEGYKIATLVLLRTGHPVTFYNYGAKEVWTTKLVKSRRYGGHLVPTFYVNKNFPWKKVPDNDLTIVIENITKDEYKNICENMLPLKGDLGEVLPCNAYGTILLEKEFEGKIFVSGLYVCSNTRIHYGYNITPEYLQLDRDRQSVTDFDLLWITSKMWSQHTNNPNFKLLLFSQQWEDLLYIKDTSGYMDLQNITSIIKTAFYDKFGIGAIPVGNQEEYDRVSRLGGNPIISTRPIRDSLRSLYEDFISTKAEFKSCEDALREWYDDLLQRVDVPKDLQKRFSDILFIYYKKLIGEV